MDSLRYWLTEMHVDGFRFDLATTLARQDGGFSRLSAFFDLVAQDPVVSQAKLIAEPWDVGQMDSYAVGEFPALWREWNGRYRDSMRDFWRSQKIGLGEFATRFAGSYDLYGDDRRRPTASVNLITVHDGFTLRDLVSYDGKHNEANGEDNRDGANDNRSWNSGAEGPTADAGRAGAAGAAVPGDAVHPAALVRRADAARRRRTRPHPGRQQQRLLPGQRDLLGRLVRGRHRAARFRPGPGGAAPGAPGAPAAPLPHRRGGGRARLVHPGRDADERGRAGTTRRRSRSASTSTARTRPTPGPTGSRCSTTTSWSW